MAKRTGAGTGGKRTNPRKPRGKTAEDGAKGKNALVQFLGTPGEIKIQAKQKKGGRELERVLRIPLEIHNPEKHLSVRLQDLQTHLCTVSLGLHQLVAGEGDGDDKEDPGQGELLK